MGRAGLVLNLGGSGSLSESEESSLLDSSDDDESFLTGKSSAGAFFTGTDFDAASDSAFLAAN